ncbi:MAG: bifunctional nuclease domain-containing protein [Planctomycetota bacterium]
MDARPSDAIALAAQNNTPIYVEKEVLDEVCNSEI